MPSYCKVGVGELTVLLPQAKRFGGTTTEFTLPGACTANGADLVARHEDGQQGGRARICNMVLRRCSTTPAVALAYLAGKPAGMLVAEGEATAKRGGAIAMATVAEAAKLEGGAMAAVEEAV